MPQGTDYIFALQSKDFKFWSFDNNGNPQLGTRPYFMKFAPDGWMDIAIQNVRNKVYKGIDRSVTVPLGYVIDGKDILTHIAYSLGLKESVYLTIASQQLNYEPQPNGIIAYVIGQNPMTPNSLTVGTITAPEGSTVRIKLELKNPQAPDDKLSGSFHTTNFTYDGFNPPGVPSPVYYDIVVPAGSGGVFSFSIQYDQGVGSTSTAEITLVNANNNAVGSYGYWYKMLYRGEVDWATYNHKGPRITCQTLEDGLPKHLKANDRQVYEYRMDEPETVNIKADGIILRNTVEYLITNGFSTTDPIFEWKNHLIDMTIIKQDAPYVGGTKEVRRQRVQNLNSVIRATQAWHLAASVTSQVEIEYDFTINLFYNPPPGINPAGIYRIVVRKINPNGTASNAHVLFSLGYLQVAIGGDYRIQGSAVFNVAPNDELYLYAFYDVEGAGGDSNIKTTYLDAENSYFRVKYLYRHPTTYVKAYRPQDLFNKLIKSMTNSEYSGAVSAFLYNNRNKVITSGNAIRGLDDATIKISFEDFFKFWDCIFSVGITEKTGFKVDMLEEHNMIDQANIIDLPEPALNSLSIQTNKDLFINEVTFGFPDISNELGVLNGSQEFNTNSSWSTESTVLTGKLNKVSTGIKATPYEFEKIRVATFQKDTTDYKNDNDCYAVHIEDIEQPADLPNNIPVHYKLDRSLNPLVTAGLIEPGTVFNLWFTPMRSFLRNAIHIHGRFYKSDQEIFFFRNNMRNKEVVCDGIIEKSFVNLRDLAPAVVTPWVFDFIVPPPEDLPSLLELNPMQVFRFPVQGNVFLGMLEKLSISPSKKDEQGTTLRSLSSNDMTKFKTYNG